MSLYSYIIKSEKEGKKLKGLLIDPDKFSVERLSPYFKVINKKIDFVLIGGSIVFSDINQIIKEIKEFVKLPVFIFPGNVIQISANADGIFLLSLISGRNPELLIGNHVISAPYIKKSGIEVIPVGYMIFESDKTTSVEYISNSKPLPADKTDIAVATAIAGEMLGLKMLYLENGSGANQTVSTEIIKRIKNEVKIPIIVGGGIKNNEVITSIFDSGADIIIIGSVIEETPSFLYNL
jgi:putative glycerol-1-phosphate prenyltransferase